MASRTLLADPGSIWSTLVSTDILSTMVLKYLSALTTSFSCSSNRLTFCANKQPAHQIFVKQCCEGRDTRGNIQYKYSHRATADCMESKPAYFTPGSSVVLIHVTTFFFYITKQMYKMISADINSHFIQDKSTQTEFSSVAASKTAFSK